MLQQISEGIRNSSFLSPWIIAPTIFLLSIVVLLLIKKSALAIVRARIAEHANWIWAETLIEALSPALTVGILAGSIAFLDRMLPLSPRSDRVFDVAVAGTLILALIIFVDHISRRLVERLALRFSLVQGALGLFQGGVRGVIIGLGVLIFLDSVGISITPLIASLGVGTLAVALALQDTLANLFAGVYMIAEKPVEAGHFVKLESGEQGHVIRVGWRNTRIRVLNDTVVVVPNSKLASSVITNFSLPNHEFAVSVDLGVDYDSDLEQVERITLDVARELMTHSESAIFGFESRMRYHTFADSSINFTVWLGARDFVSGMKIKHEFIKLLHRRYRNESISMSFPTRTLTIKPDTIDRMRELIFKPEKRPA